MNVTDKDLEKVRTTMGIKLATKYLILDHSLPGESLEDTVVRMIKTNDRLEKENIELREYMDQKDILLPNEISMKKTRRGLGVIKENDRTIFHFSYFLPENGSVDDEYIMDIITEKVIVNGNMSDPSVLDLSNKELKHIHLRMVEYIINKHFDRAFSLPRKMNLMDARYWKRIAMRVGLPERSYINDILSVLEK